MGLTTPPTALMEVASLLNTLQSMRRKVIAHAVSLLADPGFREAVVAARPEILGSGVRLDCERQCDWDALRAVQAFLELPSRRTLQAVLIRSHLGRDAARLPEVERQLAHFEEQAAARKARAHGPSQDDVQRCVREHSDHVALAVAYMKSPGGVTEVARQTGKARSTVYAAIRFFRGLPGEMQTAILENYSTRPGSLGPACEREFAEHTPGQAGNSMAEA